MRLVELALASEAVAGTRSRLDKIRLLADALEPATPEEMPVAVTWLSGSLPQGTIGVGWAALRDLPSAVAGDPTLTVTEVDQAFTEVQAATGPGSQARRKAILGDLFARATQPERRFLLGLLSGELRQGALAGIMAEAVARASGVPVGEVRRAAMVAGDLGAVAAAAKADGEAGLARYRLEVLRPIQPMLAQTAAGVDDALARIHPAAVEWKLDGARIQAHRLGREVRVFTRNLADVTERLPEVVELMAALPVQSLILDGEAIALREDGRPHPFGVTMSRFGSRLSVEEMRSRVPLSPVFFDCLHLDGEDLIARPAGERFEALARAVPEANRTTRVRCETAEEAAPVLASALASGHEGVMVKSLEAPYEAGRRGAGWLKVKVAHTLDLVVLAAEWGHGRRRGWLSNLHLGARDGDGFAMLGKTFKGMTDQMLAWQTERFQELETHRDDFAVYLRPELVVEVAFDGVLSSPRYPSGMALRFARVKGYRPDKRPEEADTVETVRAIHQGQSPA
jgi:DNA ligase-1